MICSIIPWNVTYTWRYVILKILYEGNRLQVELYEKGNTLGGIEYERENQ